MKTETGKDIGAAAKHLNNGRLVALPTETVYGLAGNAFDESAVQEIFRVKNRPSYDPLILHTDKVSKIRSWVQELPEIAETLFNHFSPGPLTVLLPKSPVISDLVTSGKPDVAFRIPDHPLTLELLSKLDFPVAAPSANPFGYISPTSPEHVERQLGSQIPYILNGGPCKVGVESTILRPGPSGVIIEREGGISREALETVLGPGQAQSPEEALKSPETPGQLKSHYSPRKKIVIGDLASLYSQYQDQKTGLLAFQNLPGEAESHPNPYLLSKNGNLAEAAQNLFTHLRQLDENPEVEIILAEYVPHLDIGRAINERLKKAAGV